MNALAHLFQQPSFHRVGWVLVHFLWQGVGIGLLLGMLLRLLNKASSHLRYLVICGALLACGTAPAITWAVLVRQDAPSRFSREPLENLATRSPITLKPPVAVLPEAAGNSGSSSWRDKGLQMLDPLLPYAVSLWSAGVLVLVFRLALGWTQLQRIRRSGTAIPDPAWETRFRQLAGRMRVSAPVQLLKSALVEVPTLIGWLQPVILLPASVFTGLTPGQLEAILAHELAHVRRCDYLVNLLQTAIETILFYHPAVWWISRKLREERENCCDDIAVETTYDRAIYASALATLEENRPFPSSLALAASGGTLLARIRRIADVDSRKSSLAPVIAAVLIVGSLAALLGGGRVLGEDSKTAPQQVELLKTIQPALDDLAKKPDAQGFYAVDGGDLLRLAGFGPGTVNAAKSHLLSARPCFVMYEKRLNGHPPEAGSIFGWDWRFLDVKTHPHVAFVTQAVPGHPDMLLLMPAETLKPGLYSVRTSTEEAEFGVETPDEEAFWREVLLDQPDSWHAHSHLGAVLWEKHDIDGALEQWKRAVELSPQLYETHNNYALALNAKGRVDEALEQLKQAVAAGGHGEVRMNYANALINAKHYDEAMAQYGAILKENPANAQALSSMGVCYFQQGKWAAAVDCFQNALKIAPDYLDAKRYLESAEQKLKQASQPAPANLETANQILNELRLLDAVIGQWAAENNKKAGDQVPPAELRLYIRKDKDERLYNALGDTSGPKDILGNPFGPFTVGGHPRVSPATVTTLSDVASPKFWQAFIAD